ncbi:6-phosphogluconolactonase [Gammaproteobacteria bacterium]|nr:6-phosphogluconolactonase [Gammaproteobacteria bacterium]
MRVVAGPSPEAAAAGAAEFIAQSLAAALVARGRATLALSGGHSAVPLLAALARQALDWSRVAVFQVDERMAPDGDTARNLTALQRALVAEGPLPAANLHPMPVTDAEPAAAAAAYAQQLRERGGSPPILDLVHLGLGADGHTASLFPGDAVLQLTAREVAVTGPHAGYRRMTLTLPVINAARARVWLVIGAGKAGVLAELEGGTSGMPAAMVARKDATVFADAAARPLRPAGR